MSYKTGQTYFYYLNGRNIELYQRSDYGRTDTLGSYKIRLPDDSSGTYFIYPDDQVMPSDSYKSGTGVIANSIADLFPEMINKINTIYSDQGITTGFKLAGHSSVNYSSYSTSQDCTWRVCLHLALMNVGNNFHHVELETNLLNIMNTNNADCLIYWRTENDSNYTSGAAKIGATKDNCMMQLSYYQIISPVTITGKIKT